jgi:hypothetical protein
MRHKQKTIGQASLVLRTTAFSGRRYAPQLMPSVQPPWRPSLGIEEQQDRANQQLHWGGGELDSCTTSQNDLNYG